LDHAIVSEEQPAVSADARKPVVFARTRVEIWLGQEITGDNKNFQHQARLDMHPSSKLSSTALKGLQPDRSTTERLFDTAATLFWKKGYAATTTREIAAAVGIRQASLYHHFANKEDLLYQISVSALKQFLTEVESAVNTVAQPLERIRVLIHAHLDTLLKYQERNVTMMTELRALTPRHRNEVVALRESYAHFARSRLEDAQDAGAIRYDISARYLSLALLNMLN